MSDPFPDEVDAALWDEACRRADAIREFLKSRTGKKSVADGALLATEFEISQAAAYRLIKLFRAGGTVMSLVERKPGRRDAIGYWMTGGRRSFGRRSTGTTSPAIGRHFHSWCGMCRRTASPVGFGRPIAVQSKLNLKTLIYRSAPNGAAKPKLPRTLVLFPGVLAASRPLPIVQVDHTKADIFAVDEETRKPIGRPWLTLAMDVDLEPTQALWPGF
ncbi:MAG: hypothetical protein ACK4P4_21345 [Allorhizobium sp.]